MLDISVLHSQCDCFVLYHLSVQCLSLFQEAEFFPARILAQQKTISEDSDLYATCSTFGLKKHEKTTVHVYLCKDDHVIKKKSQKQDQNDTTFTIPKVNLNYSGNYSCVYSLKDHSGLQVPKRGDNTITILVIGKDFHSCESIMSVLFPTTHFVLPLHSQFSPGRHRSSRAIHCQRGRRCRVEMYCF